MRSFHTRQETTRFGCWVRFDDGVPDCVKMPASGFPHFALLPSQIQIWFNRPQLKGKHLRTISPMLTASDTFCTQVPSAYTSLCHPIKASVSSPWATTCKSQSKQISLVLWWKQSYYSPLPPHLIYCHGLHKAMNFNIVCSCLSFSIILFKSFLYFFIIF